MAQISDSEGNPLRLQTLYEDQSLTDTPFQFSSICFVQSYQISEDHLEEGTILRYENGLFRIVDSASSLRLIGRKNARGDVTFENIRNYSLKPSTLAGSMLKYRTLNLDEILQSDQKGQVLGNSMYAGR